MIFSKVRHFKFSKPTRQNLLKILKNICVFLFSSYLFLTIIILPPAAKWILRHKISPLVGHTVYARTIAFNPFRFQLTVKRFEIAQIEGKQLVSLNQLKLNLSFLSLLKKSIRIQNLKLDRLYVHPTINSNGRLNFFDLIPKDTSSSENKKQPPATDKKPITITIEHLTLVNNTLQVTDQRIEHPFNQVIRPINLQIENLSTRIDRVSTINILCSIGNSGAIHLNGNVQLTPLKADIAVNIEHLPLTSLQAYLQSYTNMLIADGLLNLSGNINLNGEDPQQMKLNFDGQSSLDRFKLLEAQSKKTLISWKQLNILPIQFSLENQSLTIKDVLFDELATFPALESNGINFQNALSKETPIENDSSTLKANEQATPPDESKATKPFHFQIDQIAVNNGLIRFADRTLGSEFDVIDLSSMQIQLSGVNSQPDTIIKLNLTAMLPKKGAIELQSELMPYQNPIDIKLLLKVTNYSMQSLAPYVGKFTAQDVNSGEMTLDFNYTIAQQTITAQHNIFIQNFEFGKKIDSPDALKLPFNLAVSLLKDVNGQIKITLPVKGDLTEPQFKFTHLIGQTLSNFFIKIVTKPFSFLASLVGVEGGEEDFSYLNFKPGDAALPQSEQQKLKNIAKAFKERPLLKLQINGVFDDKDDWLELKKQTFDKEFAAMLAESEKSTEKVLELYYKKVFGFRAFKHFATEFNAQSMNNRSTGQNKNLYGEIKRQLIENAPSNTDTLTQLAVQRAENVYHFFINECQIEETRVKIGQPQQTESKLGEIPLELILIQDNSDSSPLKETNATTTDSILGDNLK